jgi:hypothetical protein
MGIVAAFLTAAGERYSPMLVGLWLALGGLSFLARHWAQTRHGRIREYGAAAVGLAAAFGGLALFYAILYLADMPYPARQGAGRILLTLLAGAAVGFNWGGVVAAGRDLRDAITRRV